MSLAPKSLNVLVIGSGGREHVLVRSLLRSPSTDKVFCAPGNAGIAKDTECVDIFAHTDIVNFCRKNEIGLVVVGPEEPLVLGLADRLRNEGVPTFGPSEVAAKIEASKEFTKKICTKFGIPTADYAIFTTREEARAYVAQKGAPIVVKANGLAAGKGVTVASTVEEAYQAIEDCFDGLHGGNQKVVIEEMLEGEEVSFFALCDGNTAVPFASAQDHKRAFDNDQGPNTGGMGSFSPTPLVTPDMQTRIMNEIVTPTIDAMRDLGIPYIGVLFAGLMLTKDGPKLIEYNCRFGDPETQVIIPRFDGDLAALLLSCAKGALDPSLIRFTDEVALCVVMAASGYPGTYVKGTAINHLDRAASVFGVALYHAGTELAGEQWLARGGRVLNIVGTASSLRQARYRAYEAIDMIDWPDGFCRRDIGARVAQHK